MIIVKVTQEVGSAVGDDSVSECIDGERHACIEWRIQTMVYTWHTAIGFAMYKWVDFLKFSHFKGYI